MALLQKLKEQEDIIEKLKSNLGGFSILSAGMSKRFFTETYVKGTSENDTITVPDKGQKDIIIATSIYITGASANVVAYRVVKLNNTSFNLAPILLDTINDSVTININYIVIGIM